MNRFPDRPVFKFWIKECYRDGKWNQYRFFDCCSRIIRSGDPGGWMYEFCAARGHLMTYNQIWEELHGKDKHATAEELEDD